MFLLFRVLTFFLLGTGREARYGGKEMLMDVFTRGDKKTKGAALVF